MSGEAITAPYPAVPPVQAPTAQAAVLLALALPGYPDGMTMADLTHRTARGWDAVYEALTGLLRAGRVQARAGKEKGQAVTRYRLRGKEGR